MKKTFIIFSLSIVTIFALGTSLSYAQSRIMVPNPATGQVGGNTPGQTGGGTSGQTGGDTPATRCNSTICIENPLKVGNTLSEVLLAIVEKVILPVGGILCVLAFIFSGFLYVTAQGNENKIKQAHRALLYSAIGTALVLGAWTFSTVIQNTIGSITKFR